MNPTPSNAEWQVQEAKQRFSEVLRRVHDDGPQVITRHGHAVAVIIDMSEYRSLSDPKPSFIDFLRSAPFPDDFDQYLDRPPDWNRHREVDFLLDEERA